MLGKAVAKPAIQERRITQTTPAKPGLKKQNRSVARKQRFDFFCHPPMRCRHSQASGESNQDQRQVDRQPLRSSPIAGEGRQNIDRLVQLFQFDPLIMGMGLGNVAWTKDDGRPLGEVRRVRAIGSDLDARIYLMQIGGVTDSLNQCLIALVG